MTTTVQYFFFVKIFTFFVKINKKERNQNLIFLLFNDTRMFTKRFIDFFGTLNTSTSVGKLEKNA